MSGNTGNTVNTVTFVDRVGCHLCDEAKETVSHVIDSVAQETGYMWTLNVVDVDSDSELLELYDWEVPVVLINGRQHSFHRVDERRLKASLIRATRTNTH